jgi:hypothetical protein
MTNQTITVAGARGGSGTTTIAAALALFAARHATTQLVPCETGVTAALLGLARPPGAAPAIAVTEQLVLAPDATQTAEVTINDAGRVDVLAHERRSGPVIAVLRGPCYLALHSIVAGDIPPLAGIVLVAEPDRSLTSRDVADVCGVPVLAEIKATPRVARTIDAGLLVTALRRLPEFTPLRRLVDRALGSRDDQAPARSDPIFDAHPSAPSSVLKGSTDMPVPLKRNRLRDSSASRRRCSTRPFFGVAVVAGGRVAEHRGARSGGNRVLHR